MGQHLPVVVVSGVLDSSDGAVGLVEGVGALHHVSVADLLLGLLVTGVCVGDRVRVLVLRVSLQLHSIHE